MSAARLLGGRLVVHDPCVNVVQVEYWSIGKRRSRSLDLGRRRAP